MPEMTWVTTVPFWLAIFLLGLFGTCGAQTTEGETNQGSASLTQADLDDFARDIQLNYSVVENSFFVDSRYLSELTLTNNGEKSFPGSGWTIVFAQTSILEPDSYPYPNGLEKPKYGVRFFSLGGNLYRMSPTRRFGTIQPGKSKAIRWINKNANVAYTDNFPNWYIAAPNLQARILESTRGESFDFVAPYDTPATWKRNTIEDDKNYDEYDPFTAEERYRHTVVEDKGRAPIPVIPTPLNVESQNVQSTLNIRSGTWVVVTSPRLANEGRYLAEQWNLRQSLRVPVTNYINIIETPVQVLSRGRPLPLSESYEVQVDSSTNIIIIKAAQPAGAFYGVQTLIALADQDGNIPTTVIRDGPRYPYRGLMLDVARNFFPKEVVFRVIDLMSIYKLNKLHLHLTDDEGWRLSIPGLEELTELGATRCHDYSETKCLLPFLGTGPFPGPPGSGYYTVEDYRAILRYAQSRHIEVIPEIDMPGHSHAAIKAMETRYRRRVNLNVSEASRFLLSDLADESEYRSIQGFVDNAINPCLRSTYSFISRIVNSLYAMHRDISPLKVFHFGGDEVARGAWEKSPVCDRLRDSGMNADLKLYLASQIANMTSLYNLDLAAWEDGLSTKNATPIPRNDLPNRNVYIYAWNNVIEFGTAGRAYDYANSGYKVIMAPATHLYLDHPQEPDPKEPGLYWSARYTDTKKVFSVIPEHIYWNSVTTRSGKKMNICTDESECPSLKEPGNIEGIQASLFGELIRSQDIMDYMLLPRLLAAAERAWHEAPWESQEDADVREAMLNRDWTDFANTVGYVELARLGRLGYMYRIPPPGAYVENDIMKTSTAFPGLNVEMSSDGGKTWTVVNPQGEKVDKNRDYLLRTKAASGTRYSRVISLSEDRNTGSTFHLSMLSTVAIVTTAIINVLTISI